MIIALPVLFALGAKYALESLLLPDDVIYLVKTMIEYGGIIGIVYLMMMGPANPHTANDNTSGVTTIVSIMEDLPENLRENVAFIFFDLEEVGLLGSAAFYASHKKNVQDKLLLNFDCVSDGKNILFAIKKGAVKYTHALKAAFPETEIFKPDFATKGFFYPSDQAKFPLGVGVAALKKSKRGILYMNRIHTAKDTVFDEANIDYLTEGALKLAEIISIS